jgi:hypothetical protein
VNQRKSATIALIAVVAFIAFYIVGSSRGVQNKQVPASTVSQTVCGTHGPPVRATLINNAGANQYSVVCGDGIIVGWVR